MSWQSSLETSSIFFASNVLLLVNLLLDCGKSTTWLMQLWRHIGWAGVEWSIASSS